MHSGKRIGGPVTGIMTALTVTSQLAKKVRTVVVVSFQIVMIVIFVSFVRRTVFLRVPGIVAELSNVSGVVINDVRGGNVRICVVMSVPLGMFVTVLVFVLSMVFVLVLVMTFLFVMVVVLVTVLRFVLVFVFSFVLMFVLTLVLVSVIVPMFVFMFTRMFMVVVRLVIVMVFPFVFVSVFVAVVVFVMVTVFVFMDHDVFLFRAEMIKVVDLTARLEFRHVDFYVDTRKCGGMLDIFLNYFMSELG